MAPQGLHEGAFVCSLEMCVPVTLLSVLCCLPLLRSLAAGPEGQGEKHPFMPRSILPQLRGLRPTQAWLLPPQETVCIYYFRV